MVIKRTESGLTENAGRILDLLDEIWEQLQPKLGSPNYKGCIVQIDQLRLPSIPTTILVGDVGAHEARLIELVTEKNARLRERNFSAGHLTSRQSRDPSCAKLGGAIVTQYAIAGIAGPLIIGVAGLTEEANEAFALTFGRLTGFLDREGADRIAAINHNQLYLELLMPTA